MTNSPHLVSNGGEHQAVCEPYKLLDDAVIDADALATWLGKKRSWVIDTASHRRRRKLALPALKIGREWRFRVGDIRRWLVQLANGRAA